MLSPSTFRDVVSGRQKGVAASIGRGLLGLAEGPYGWAVRRRNRRYDSGHAEVHRIGVPVVSVGNLSLGGTGKTPLVEWIARQYQDSGRRVAIVSRGYGASAEGPNDEALELELALPGVPHVQNPDRVAAGREAIDRYGAELIVLDDGFQHRRLGRNLDVVLLDATEPFGYERIFPRGTLREPLDGLARADVVVLSRADMLEANERNDIRERVAQLAPEAVWCEVVHRPQSLLNVNGEREPLSSLAGKRVAAFCGIGNPAGFRHTLETLDYKVALWREFADHYHYTAEDVGALREWAAKADAAVCTRKDLVKLQNEKLGDVPLWAMGVELDLLDGREMLEKRLDKI